MGGLGCDGESLLDIVTPFNMEFGYSNDNVVKMKIWSIQQDVRAIVMYNTC